MERFISPNNFPSFFKRYLSQLLTSPSASENGISQETPRAIGKGSIGKLILDSQLSPRLVVPLAMGPNTVGRARCWYRSPRYQGQWAGCIQVTNCCICPSSPSRRLWPRAQPEAHPAGRAETELEAGTVTQPQHGQHSLVCRCTQGLTLAV